jgi:hypothetical protein
MEEYLLAAMRGHDLEQGDGADEVVVVVEQGFLHALTNSLESGEVNHSFKPAINHWVQFIRLLMYLRINTNTNRQPIFN